MKRVIAALFALFLFAPTLAQAAAINPFITVLVNGESRDLSGSIRPVIVGDRTLFAFEAEDIQFEAGIVSLSGLYDPDPFISFGVTTTNLIAGPVTYAFLFGTPVVPGFYTYAESTGDLSLTSGVKGTATVATSSIYPTFISGYGTLGAVPTNLGVDLGTTSCVAGPGAPFSVTASCALGAASNTFASTFYDNLEGLLTYTQDDAGSVASWTGLITLSEVPPSTAVPEPTSMLLLGTGVAGVIARRRRRQ